MFKESETIEFKKSTAQNNQCQNAADKLEELGGKKFELKRPVFFVPGWTDEACVCWMTSYLKRGTCMKEWASKVIKNSDLVNYVSFSTKESEGCKSFFDFGDILKEKIWERIGKKTDFDLQIQRCQAQKSTWRLHSSLLHFRIIKIFLVAENSIWELRSLLR